MDLEVLARDRARERAQALRREQLRRRDRLPVGAPLRARRVRRDNAYGSTVRVGKGALDHDEAPRIDVPNRAAANLVADRNRSGGRCAARAVAEPNRGAIVLVDEHHEVAIVRGCRSMIATAQYDRRDGHPNPQA
jgi:hypothetical protein